MRELLGGGADFVGKIDGLLIDHQLLELKGHLPLQKKRESGTALNVLLFYFLNSLPSRRE